MPKLASKGSGRRPTSLLHPRQLEAIVAVARAGSVHAAARTLGMPQPGLSRIISASEKMLGLELFERSPTGSRITERGNRVLRQAAFALRALSEVSEHARERLPVVRLGCIPRVMQVLVPQLLAQIGNDEAGFRLQVSVGTSNEMAASLETAHVDFVIARRAALASNEAGIQVEKLYNENTVVVCARQRRDLPPSPLSLPDLARLPWVLPRPGFYSRDALDALFAAAGLSPIVPVIECDAFESNMAVVATTRFITLAPEFAARRSERVRILRTDARLGASPVMLQYRRGQEEHPAFPAFRAAAIRAARRVDAP